MQRQKRASLALERLEERWVPATIHFSKGTLLISNPRIYAGTTSLTISQVAANKFTVVDGASFNGTFSGVDYIIYNGTNFKDTVTFDLTRFNFGGSALFRTGNGDDRLDFRAAGGSLGGNLTVLPGLGNDTVNLNCSGTGAITTGGTVNVSDPDDSYTLQNSHGNTVSPLSRFTTVTSGAHGPSITNQHSDPLAGGHAAPAPGGPPGPAVQGDLFFVSAVLAMDREAPGRGPEASASEAPPPITPTTPWNCSAPGLSAGHGSGAASAAHFRYVSESAWPGRQALDALPTGNSSIGGGLSSRGGETTAGNLADPIWLPVAGSLPALEAGAVTTRLGDGWLVPTADNSGSGSLQTASELTLGFLLAGSLGLHLGSQSERPTLLLVDSDEDTRDAMTMMLFTEGYQVVAVATGRDAWNVLRSPFAPIDMMLLDVQLPDISGLHLIQRLRQSYPTLPVFAWMCGSDPAEEARLGQLGVYHYARAQPAELADLVKSVQAFLRGASHP